MNLSSIGFSSRNLSSVSSLISRAIFKFTHYIYPLFLSMVLRYRSILNIELHYFRKKNFLRWHNCDDMQATFLCVQAQFFKYILKFVQLYLEICSNTFFRQTQSFKVFVITIVAMISYLTRRCSCLGALSGDLLRLTADFLRFSPLIFLSFLSPSAPLLSPFTSCKLSPSFKQTTNLKNKRKFEGESASGCSAHQRQEIQLRGIFSQLNAGKCKAKHILTTSEKFHN